MKDVIISTDGKKEYVAIFNTHSRQKLSEIGREWNVLNLAEATDEKSTANAILDEIFFKSIL